MVWINFINFRFISIKLLVFFFNPGEGVGFSTKRSIAVIACCTTSFPFGDIQTRHAHPISPGCHQLYVVIVAKPYAWLQELCFWRPSSAVP